MRSLVTNVDMAQNHDIGEMHNLDSERQIKQSKEILASKEQKLQKLVFDINKMKEEEKKKIAIRKASGRREIYDSIYKQNMRR